MAEYKGMAYLRRKLDGKQRRVDLRYRYYEMKNAVEDFSRIIPPEFRSYAACLGWCGKAVDSLADRLVFRIFRNDNFDLNTIYQMNNPDILFSSAVLSALIASCSFLYISPGEDGFPRLQVIDGGNATGVLDDTTGLLTEGYAVLLRDDYGRPVQEAYFRAGETWYTKFVGYESNSVLSGIYQIKNAPSGAVITAKGWGMQTSCVYQIVKLQ